MTKKRKVGRKPKKRKFYETKVGFLLRYEAPLEYKLIMGFDECVPDCDLIENISYSSNNPLFKKSKFRKALIEYRKYGLFPPHFYRKKPTIALYHIEICRNEIKKNN